MIEFDEFLQIIKGGSATGKSAGGNDSGSGAIYNFFKNLTTGKLQHNDE